MKTDSGTIKNALKIAIPLIIIAVVVTTTVGYSIVNDNLSNTVATPDQNDEIVTATIIIKYGDGTIATYSIVTKNATIYGFLMEAAKEGNFDVKTTYYSGFDSLLIDSIGGYTGGDDNKWWSYYINDEYGTIGADKQMVNSGDVVEWKFEEFEW